MYTDIDFVTEWQTWALGSEVLGTIDLVWGSSASAETFTHESLKANSSLCVLGIHLWMSYCWPKTIAAFVPTIMYTNVDFETSAQGVLSAFTSNWNQECTARKKNYIETMAYENILARKFTALNVPNLQYKLQPTFLMKNRHATNSGLKFLAISMYYYTAQAKLQGVVCAHSWPTSVLCLQLEWKMDRGGIPKEIPSRISPQLPRLSEGLCDMDKEQLPTV